MPRAPKRCSSACSKKAIAKGKCEDHQPERIPWQKTEGSKRPFLSTPEWQMQRRRVLYRDNELRGGCQLRLEGCTLKATTVDHKLPVWYSQTEQVADEELQGLCPSCHQKKSSFEGVQAKRIKKSRRVEHFGEE